MADRRAEPAVQFFWTPSDISVLLGHGVDSDSDPLG